MLNGSRVKREDAILELGGELVQDIMKDGGMTPGEE